jgi:hypothetical protein
VAVVGAVGVAAAAARASAAAACHAAAAEAFDVAFAALVEKMGVNSYEVASADACAAEQISRAGSFAGACPEWLGGVVLVLPPPGAEWWDLSPPLVLAALPLSLTAPPKAFLVHHHFLGARQA